VQSDICCVLVLLDMGAWRDYLPCETGASAKTGPVHLVDFLPAKAGFP